MHRETQGIPATRRWTFIVIGAALLSAVAAFEINAACTFYSNSRPYYTNGSAVCAFTGSGCTECVDGDSNSCVTNGNSCQPRQQFYW